MALDKILYLYSVATDAFYTQEEQYIHKRLLKLYKARQKKNIPQWRKKCINRLIKKEKNKLTELLDQHIEKKEARRLNVNALSDKNIISLFESSLTRALDLKVNELTKDLMIVNVFFFQVFNDLVKYGFDYEGERYIFLTASAGQIRTKRAVFVKKSAYDKIEQRLMCGLSIEDINAQGGINTN